jgi:hypothetical protein
MAAVSCEVRTEYLNVILMAAVFCEVRTEYLNVILMIAAWLRLLVTDLSLQRTGFDRDAVD